MIKIKLSETNPVTIEEENSSVIGVALEDNSSIEQGDYLTVEDLRTKGKMKTLEESELEKGDLVRLKSGGPVMTVEYARFGDVKAHYFYKGDLKQVEISVGCVKKVKEDEVKYNIQKVNERY